MRVERGAAINVKINDPTNSPGRLSIPNEIAPSSRNGKTTKYALNTCMPFKLKLKLGFNQLCIK